jgi:hypothetical protein
LIFMTKVILPIWFMGIWEFTNYRNFPFNSPFKKLHPIINGFWWNRTFPFICLLGQTNVWQRKQNCTYIHIHSLEMGNLKIHGLLLSTKEDGRTRRAICLFINSWSNTRVFKFKSHLPVRYDL